MKYVQQGDEGITLDILFEYCIDNPTSIVTYLHDKGSFHSTTQNDNMRFMLTKSIFSDECQTIKDTNMCNTCAARFSFVPHLHFPGNMWTAHCSYVKDLIRPTEFPTKMQNMVDAAQKIDDLGANLEYLHLSKFPWKIGLGRFAYEHWLTSHPDVKPCDVYPGPYRVSYTKLPKKYDSWKPKLQKAGWLSQDQFPGTKNEWSCGRGRMFEFHHLYGNHPPPTSFIWDQYDMPTPNCPHPIKRPL
jgi:hypothetical protein